ncbi:hypothetical protein ABGT15_09870 [Flavobacterium enshiense]|uniref:hypothetical protein n=1 Tax=Flavobacterium enshiense TaxID=1341165 RepID=UPI00345CA481
MKKICLIFTLLTLISCKKENTLQDTVTESHHSKFKSHTTTRVSIDTAFFSYDSKRRQNDYVLVYVLQKQYDKDSICKATFRLDFVQNQKRMYSRNVVVNGFYLGAAWYANYELDSVASPLKSVNVGVEACGYTQTHFLFYIDGKKSDLVHQWESMSDSGWGSWSEIISGTPNDFYFRTEAFLPADETPDENEEWGINTFSDSTHFQLKNGKWIKTQLTEKGKTYRSKKLTFNEYNKIDE